MPLYSDNTDDKEIRMQFERLGLRPIHIITKRATETLPSHAFVEFSSQQEALAAIRNGLTLSGRQVPVEEYPMQQAKRSYCLQICNVPPAQHTSMREWLARNNGSFIVLSQIDNLGNPVVLSEFSDQTISDTVMNQLNHFTNCEGIPLHAQYYPEQLRNAPRGAANNCQTNHAQANSQSARQGVVDNDSYAMSMAAAAAAAAQTANQQAHEPNMTQSQQQSSHVVNPGANAPSGAATQLSWSNLQQQGLAQQQMYAPGYIAQAPAYIHPTQYQAMNQDESFRDSLPLKLVIPKDSVGSIIGKGGQNIREIQSVSGAKVDVDRFGEVYLPEMQAKKICIAGSLDCCAKACRAILLCLFDENRNSQNEKSTVLRMLGPNCLIGRVIGRFGNTIKSMMHETNTKMAVKDGGTVDSNGYPFERIIAIEGNLDDVVRASTTVLKTLRQAFEQGGAGLYNAQAAAAAAQLAVQSANAEINSNQSPTAYGIYGASVPAMMPASQLYSRNSYQPYLMNDPNYLSQGYSGLNHIMPSFLPGATPNMSSYTPSTSSASSATPVRPKDLDVAYLFVPASSVGAIIGSRGNTIRQMCHISGAVIKVASEADDDSDCRDASVGPVGKSVREWRRVTIKGGFEDQYKAQLLLFQQVMTDQAYGGNLDDIRLRIDVPVPRLAIGRIIGKGGQTVREIQRVGRLKLTIPDANHVRSSSKNTFSAMNDQAAAGDSSSVTSSLDTSEKKNEQQPQADSSNSTSELSKDGEKKTQEGGEEANVGVESVSSSSKLSEHGDSLDDDGDEKKEGEEKCAKEIETESGASSYSPTGRRSLNRSQDRKSARAGTKPVIRDEYTLVRLVGGFASCQYAQLELRKMVDQVLSSQTNTPFKGRKKADTENENVIYSSSSSNNNRTSSSAHHHHHHHHKTSGGVVKVNDDNAGDEENGSSSIAQISEEFSKLSVNAAATSSLSSSSKCANDDECVNKNETLASTNSNDRESRSTSSNIDSCDSDKNDDNLDANVNNSLEKETSSAKV